MMHNPPTLELVSLVMDRYKDRLVFCWMNCGRGRLWHHEDCGK